MQAKNKEEKNPPLVLSKPSPIVERGETSKNLSHSLCLKLMNLIEHVNSQDVTPESVHAACNAASQIHKILRLNFDMKKEGI